MIVHDVRRARVLHFPTLGARLVGAIDAPMKRTEDVRAQERVPMVSEWASARGNSAGVQNRLRGADESAHDRFAGRAHSSAHVRSFSSRSYMVTVSIARK